MPLKFHYILLLVIFQCSIANAQVKCNDFKIDTLYMSVLIEEEAKFKHYTDGHSTFQDNLIIPFNKYRYTGIYATDSVIFKEPYFIKGSAPLVPCMDVLSFTNFFTSLEKGSYKGIRIKKIGIDDVQYFQVFLNALVVDLGMHQIAIPENNNEDSNSYKMKDFKHVLQIIKIIDFRF